MKKILLVNSLQNGVTSDAVKDALPDILDRLKNNNEDGINLLTRTTGEDLPLDSDEWKIVDEIYAYTSHDLSTAKNKYFNIINGDYSELIGAIKTYIASYEDEEFEIEIVGNNYKDSIVSFVEAIYSAPVGEALRVYLTEYAKILAVTILTDLTDIDGIANEALNNARMEELTFANIFKDVNIRFRTI